MDVSVLWHTFISVVQPQPLVDDLATLDHYINKIVWHFLIVLVGQMMSLICSQLLYAKGFAAIKLCQTGRCEGNVWSNLGILSSEKICPYFFGSVQEAILWQRSSRVLLWPRYIRYTILLINFCCRSSCQYRNLKFDKSIFRLDLVVLLKFILVLKKVDLTQPHYSFPYWLINNHCGDEGAFSNVLANCEVLLNV